MITDNLARVSVPSLPASSLVLLSDSMTNYSKATDLMSTAAALALGFHLKSLKAAAPNAVEVTFIRGY